MSELSKGGISATGVPGLLPDSGDDFPYDYRNVSNKISLEEADRLLGTALHNYKNAVELFPQFAALFEE